MEKLINKLIKNLTSYKDINNLYYDIELAKIKHTKKYETLEKCILTSDSLIKENLKKIYQIPSANDQEILKNHTEENIKKLFSVFDEDDIKIIEILMKKNIIKTNKNNTEVIAKMCIVGLCFKILNEAGDDEYYIPNEIKDIWYENLNNITTNEIIDNIKKIVKMCGVIKTKELYEIYSSSYDLYMQYKEFKFWAYALSIVSRKLYSNEDYFARGDIKEDTAKKYLKVQEKIKYNTVYMNDKDIIDLYRENEYPMSPICTELLEYAQKLKTDVDNRFIIEITELLKNQIKFEPDEILDKVYEFIPALSKVTKTIIMEFIIRIYHDTRLYKYRGFKPFEIEEYLTNEELDKIEEEIEIVFKDRDYLRLADIYPDALYGDKGIEKLNEDGTTSYQKKFYIKMYAINKSKKFITYLNEKTQSELEKLCRIYCIKHMIRRASVHKEIIIDYIEENKEEILEYNYATLEKYEFDFLNDIIKKDGYVEILENGTENLDYETINNLIEKGFIFTREKEKGKNNIFQIHIPKDTLEIVKHIFNQYNPKQILDLRNLLEGIAIAYGAITKGQARKIVEEVKPNLLKYFDKFSDLVNYNGEANYSMLYTNVIENEREILSIDGLEIGNIEELLNIDTEYKIYSYDDYMRLGEQTYERKTTAYKRLDKYLKESFKKSELEKLEYIIDNYYFKQQVNEIKAKIELVDNIHEVFIINVPHADLIYDKLINMVIDISNQMPQWKLKGDIKQVNIKKEENKERKIGRNELCFCGSGKKYKKCHGRNID